MARALGPELAAKLDPGYPADNPVVTQEAWSGDGLGDRRADRRGAPLDRPRRRGQRLQQLGGLGRAQRHRLAADRRRPAPATEHAGHLVPGRPHARRPLRPRRLAAGHAGRLHGPEQRRLLDLHQRDGRRPGPLRRAGRGRPLPLRRRVAAARSRARGDPGQGPRRARGARRAHHPPRPARQRGARRRRGRAAGPALADARPADRLPGHVRPARDRLRPGAGRQARGPQLARLEPDLGRPPRLDRLQADRPPAAAQGRLPRPAEAGLDGRVRVGGDDPLRRAAGDGRPRERLPGHRQQPHRRRRLPAPHHQRVARRLPRRADRAAAARQRRARHRRLRGDAVRQPLAAGHRGGAAAGPADAAGPARAAARSSGCAAGTGGSTPTRSPARSTRPSCCAWRARSPAPRSATATSASAGSTAPTTASPRTSPRPGAGTRT